MKNAVILHGTGETDQSFWFPYTKSELEKKGYSVSIPNLPNTDTPTNSPRIPKSTNKTKATMAVMQYKTSNNHRKDSHRVNVIVALR